MAPLQGIQQTSDTTAKILVEFGPFKNLNGIEACNIFSQAKLMQFVHFIFAMARSHHRRAGTHKGEHIVPRHRTWRQSRLPGKETPKATLQKKSWLLDYQKIATQGISQQRFCRISVATSCLVSNRLARPNIHLWSYIGLEAG